MAESTSTGEGARKEESPVTPRKCQPRRSSVIVMKSLQSLGMVAMFPGRPKTADPVNDYKSDYPTMLFSCKFEKAMKPTLLYVATAPHGCRRRRPRHAPPPPNSPPHTLPFRFLPAPHRSDGFAKRRYQSLSVAERLQVERLITVDQHTARHQMKEIQLMFAIQRRTFQRFMTTNRMHFECVYNRVCHHWMPRHADDLVRTVAVIHQHQEMLLLPVRPDGLRAVVECIDLTVSSDEEEAAAGGNE